MNVASPNATNYDDILALPEHKVGEVINGTLHAQPRPAPWHVRFSSGMGLELFGVFDRGRNGYGNWWTLDELELHLGNDVLVPRPSWLAAGSMPELPNTAWFEQVHAGSV